MSDEVYKKLKKAKLPGESFSSAIMRSLEAKPKLADLIGMRTLTKEDWRRTKRSLAKAERITYKEMN